MTRSVVNACGRSLGPYSDAVRAGELLLLSGRVGLIDGVLAEGIQAQTAAAIRNAGAVLAAAGLGLKEVLRCTLYLVDMSDIDALNSVYAGFFEEPRPARTTVAVAALPLGARFEIEMTALAASVTT